jgi:hypothetical protein
MSLNRSIIARLLQPAKQRSAAFPPGPAAAGRGLPAAPASANGRVARTVSVLQVLARSGRARLILCAFTAALGSFAVSAAPAVADTTIGTTAVWDGSTAENPFGYPDTSTYGQTVTAPGASLNSFTFYMELPAGLVFRGEVYAWSASLGHATGPALYESADTQTTNPSAFQPITFDTGGVNVTPGGTYVLFATIDRDRSADSGKGTGNWGNVAAGSYTGGNFVFFNDTGNSGEWITTAWSHLTVDLAFTASFTGPVSAATSTISASPSSITANGSSTSTITVQAEDATGTFEKTGGAAVTLSTTAGALSGVSDNGDGTYTATLTSTTTAGSPADVSGTIDSSPITSGDASVTFVADAPTIVTHASRSVHAGGGVTDTATLSGGSAPTGIVTFRLFGAGNATCSGPPVFTSTKTVAGDGGYTSGPFTKAAAGTHHWIAAYSGDAGNLATATSCGDPAGSVVVANTCPAATGRLSGDTLGLLTLGMTRKQAIGKYTHTSAHGARYEDFFCTSPIGVRVGYGSPSLLKTLTSSERARVQGRVVLVLTANPFYALHGVRPGARLRSAAKKLHTAPMMRVGLNEWYMAANGSSTAVLKVRAGIVKEIGIATKLVTQSRKAQLAFIKSFS